MPCRSLIRRLRLQPERSQLIPCAIWSAQRRQHILEEVMQAVARGASDEVLREVDQLISEGHSPTHFARQMVRFLRN